MTDLHPATTKYLLLSIPTITYIFLMYLHFLESTRQVSVLCATIGYLIGGLIGIAVIGYTITDKKEPKNADRPAQ